MIKDKQIKSKKNLQNINTTQTSKQKPMNDSKPGRKNSSDSERSLASFSTLMSESKSQTKDVIELQKKMKVLRDAVLRERQEKDALTKTKNDFASEVERLRIQIQEKDAYCLKLRAENADLQDKLQVERKKAENFAQQSSKGAANISGVFGDLFGNNKKTDEYQKLLTDHNYLRKQLEVVLEKLTKSESVIDQQRRENKQQIENLQKKITEKEKELEDKVHAYIALGHKNQDLTIKHEALIKEKNKVEEELHKARKELELVNNERDELERSNTDKLRTMNEMNEVCQKMEKEIETLTEKITQLTSELEESELKLQVFDLKKVGKIVETPAQILLRKNIVNEHIIEVENAGERMTIYPQSIQSFGPYKETEDKFYIEYKGSNGRVQKDTFVSSDRKKVLKHLMTLVKTGQENKSSSDSKKNSVVDKNLFSQVVSFFGN